MPSPEVIDLTLSDDEIQPDPIRSDRGPPAPNQATNRFRASSSTPPTSGINRTRRILPVIQSTFAAIDRAENYLPLRATHAQPSLSIFTRLDSEFGERARSRGTTRLEQKFPTSPQNKKTKLTHCSIYVPMRTISTPHIK